MTRLTRILAYGMGALLLAVVVLLALAGVSAAVALVVTAVAVLTMIALGGLLGGRSTPDRHPAPWPPAPPASGEPSSVADDAPGSGDDSGTMEK